MGVTYSLYLVYTISHRTCIYIMVRVHIRRSSLIRNLKFLKIKLRVTESKSRGESEKGLNVYK